MGRHGGGSSLYGTGARAAPPPSDMWRCGRTSERSGLSHVIVDGRAASSLSSSATHLDATVQCAFLASLEFPAQGFLYETCSDVRDQIGSAGSRPDQA